MTIDEAIEHAEHVAANCDGECSEDHRQLAEWLRELVKARHNITLLMAEVHTLRDERARYEDLEGILDRYWGIEVEWDGLRRLWYVGLNDRGVMERSEREAEYDELRELVRDMWRDGMCECDERGACAQGECHCKQCEYHFPDRMRKLGIEVVEVRHSTQEEKDDYEAMLKRKSVVLTASEEFEQLKSENASLRGAVQGLGELCDKYRAENAKLRMCLGEGCADCAVGMGEYADSLCDPLKAENAKLRELAAQALQIIKHVNVVMAIDYARYGVLMSMARELGIEA